MKNFILSLFIASFALASMATENDKKCSKEKQSSKEIVLLDLSGISDTGQEMDIVTKFAIFLNKQDRTSLSLTCHSYGEYVRHVNVEMSARYQEEIGSLLACQSIFDLKKHHFNFFRHVNKYFPEMFDTLVDGHTVFEKALQHRNEIAAIFLLVLDESETPFYVTAATALHNGKINVFERYFATKYTVGEWRNERWERVKKRYTNEENFLSPNFHELLDILVNCPNGTCTTQSPLKTLMPIILDNSYPDYDKHLKLFIEAGSVCDVASFTEDDFNRFFNSSAWKIFLANGLITKKAIAINLKRMVQKVIWNEGTVANSTLESFLTKYEGGDINVEVDQENALTVAFSFTRISPPSPAMSVVRLLLDNGADPHHKLLSRNGGSKKSHFSPIIKLLEDHKRYVKADMLDVFMELLEECKKRNFVLDDYIQWVGANEDWIYQPRLCEFLIKNGIDPLMACKGSSPLKYALDASLSGNHFRKSDARKSLDIMLSHCRDPLSADLLASILPNDIVFDEYVLSLVREGFPGKVWASKQDVRTWMMNPQICKHFIQTENFDPLVGDNLDSIPIMRVLSYLGGSNSDSALDALEVMLPCCRDRLIDNPLLLTPKQKGYLEKRGKLNFFLENGFKLSQKNDTDVLAISLPTKQKEYLEKIGKLEYFLENGFNLSQTNCTDVSADYNLKDVLTDKISTSETEGFLNHYETPIASDVVDGKCLQKLDDIWILRFLMIPLLIMFYTSS